MNVKNWMLALALAGLGTACNDEVTQDIVNPSADNEIQLIFSSSSEGVDYDTRAIATESESHIENLKIYVFASEATNGTYSYLETWTKSGVTDKDNNQFTLDASGNNKKATIYPHEKLGVPYLKLYCVANMDELLDKDGNKVTLTPVTTEEGSGVVTDYGTTESDFIKIYSSAVTNEFIKTPLVMSGMGSTKISGSVSKVNIDLYRTVARFDIDNTTTRSQLTIDSITFANARNRGPLYTGDPIDVVEKPTTDPEGWLITYPGVDFGNLPNANLGETLSAFYVHPNLPTDSTYMIIKGTYKSPASGDQIPVVYTLPVAQTQEGSNTATYIEIKRNNRYKLRIMDVTAANIFGSFEVVDWTSGGGIHVKPDNTAPEFDKTMVTGLEGSTTPIVEGNNLKLNDDSGSFLLKTVATGHVEAQIEQLTKAEGWLKLEDTQYAIGGGKDTTTFKFSYTAATGQMPYRVTLINQSASYDPDLQTVLIISGPLAAPIIADAGEHSLGNTIDVTTNPAAPEAVMYKAKGSKLVVKVTGIDGIAVDENEIPKGFTITAGKTDGFTTDYTIAITDTALIESAAPKIIFRNAKDDTKRIKTEISIDLKQTEMALIPVTHAAAIFDADTIKVDADALADGSFTFKIKSPQGHTDPANLSNGSKWINISAGSWTDSDSTTTYTAKLADGAQSNKDDFEIKFKNKLSNAPGKTVTLKKLPSKPKLSDAGKTTEMGENTVTVTADDPYTATASMYLSDKNSELYIKVDCPEELVFGDAAANLTIEPISSGSKIYKITIPTASLASFNPTTPAKVTFRNKEDNSRFATLTITMKSPSASVVATNASYVNITSSTITVDTKAMDTDVATDAGNLKFKAPKGSKIAISNNSNKWATLTLKNGSEFTGTDIICGVTLQDPHSETATSCTITITNSITGLPETFTVMAKP